MTTREIKFRAWDKIKKSMMYRFAISPDAKVVGWNGFKEAWTRVENEDDYILMQYTGLKDKNGVEIYEGDIVAMTLSKGSAVEFLTGSYWFGGKPLWEYHDLCEVIGNIYETPELLQ